MADSVTVQIKAMLDDTNVMSKIENMQKMFKSIGNIDPKISGSLDKQAKEIEQAFVKLQQRINGGFSKKSDATGLNKDFTKLQTLVENYQRTVNSIDFGKLDFSQIILTGDALKQIDELNDKLTELKTNASEFGKNTFSKKYGKNKDKSLEDMYNTFQGTKGISDNAKKRMSVVGSLIQKGDIDSLREALSLLEQIKKKNLAGLSDQSAKTTGGNIVDQMASRIKSQYVIGESEKFGSASQIVEEMKNVQEEAAKSSANMDDLDEKLGKAGVGAGELANKTAEASEEAQQLNSRFKMFFSLMNGARIFKNIVKQAKEAVSTIDEAMTATAVVSSESVSSMWDKLPDYTASAKQLGSTIADVVSAQTLYVQQGLSLDASMGLAVQTLQMARVAGLDASTATNAMTAALHGFNMELTEASAKRVNDVYSHLAQISASNVEEISTAMTKVASIANAANMEFETTSAFLSTIIETTREAPETAGTALKTVIARFSEVKSLYSEDQLSGTDEEGQTIDVNKIATALRTAGIDLNKYFLGEVGLDDIFLELASKWDSLTNVQQRYIATQAAGSRQQSRFIALMQNYDRTVELVDEAYNSAGSGQEQFDKTLESYESKVNQMKSAWQEFLMGLANSDLIKGGIDAVTKFLEKVNSLIDSLSNKSKGMKSVISAGGLIGSFLLGKGAISGGLNFLGKGLGLPGLIKKEGGLGLSGQLSEYVVRNVNGLSNIFGGVVGKTRGLQGLKDKFKSLNPQYLMQAFTGGQYGAVMNPKAFLETMVGGAQAGLPLDQAVYSKFLDKAREQIAKNNYGKLSEEARNAESEEDYVNRTKTGLSEEDEKLAKSSAEAQTANEAFSELSSQLNAVGNAAGVAGGLFMTLANVIGESSQSAKIWSSICKGLGTALLAFCAITKVAMVAIKVFSISATASIASIPIIGWLTAIISLVIGVVAAIRNLQDTRTVAEKLADDAEDAANAYDNWSKRLEELKDQYSDLQNGIEKLNDANEKLNETTKGTEDWTAALNNVNEAVWELIESFGVLAQYTDIGANGEQIIDFNKEINGKTANEQIEELKNNITETEKKMYAANITSQKAVNAQDINTFWEQQTKNNILKEKDFTNSQMGENSGGRLFDSAGITGGRILNEQGIKIVEDLLKAGWTDFTYEGLSKSANNNGITNDWWNKDGKVMRSEIEGISLFMQQMQSSGAISSYYELIGKNASVDIGMQQKLLRSEQQNLMQTGMYSNEDALIASNYFNIQRQNLEKRASELGDLSEEELKNYYASTYNDSSKYGAPVIENGNLKILKAGTDDEYEVDTSIENAQKNGKYYQAAENLKDNFNGILKRVKDLDSGLTKSLLTGNKREFLNSIANRADGASASDQTDFNVYKDFYNLTEEEAEVMYEENIIEMTKSITKQYSNIYSKLSKKNKQPTKVLKEFNKYYQAFDDLTLGRLESIYSSVSKKDQSGQITGIIENKINELLESNTQDAQNLIQETSELSIDNPALLAQQLSNNIEKANSSMKKYWQELQKGYKSTGVISDSSLLYSAIKNNQAELQSELEDAVADGTISIDELDSLTSKFSDLKTVIEETNITSMGLARALELIGENKLNISSLTGPLAAVLSEFDKVKSIIHDVIQETKNFDAGESEQDVSSFFSNNYKTVYENYKKGYWGDSQNFKIMRQFFGQNYYDSASTDEEYKNLTQAGLDRLKKMNTGRFAESEWRALIGKTSDNGLKVTENSNGGIDFTGWESLTKQDIIAGLKQMSGVDSDYFAQALFAAYSLNDSSFSDIVDKNNGEAQFQQQMEKMQSAINQQGYYTTQDLQSIATATGRDYSEILKYAEETGKLKNELYDANGELRAFGDTSLDIKDEMSNNGKTYNENIFEIAKQQGNFNRGSNNKELYNYENLVQSYQDQYKISREEAEKLSQTYLNNQQDAFVQFANGSISAISTINGEWAKAVNKDEQNQTYRDMAYAFVEIFNENPITVNLNSEEISEDIQIVDTLKASIDALSDKDIRVTTTFESNEQGAATGGYVPAMANGGRRLKGGTTLTGELGPELVWNGEKGYSYLTGLGGPNFVDLKPGDRVFDANKTKKILAQSGTAKYGALARGNVVGSAAYEGLTGTGKNKKVNADWIFRDEEKWLKNPFEHLYNINQDLERYATERESLEEEYNRIIKKQVVSASEVYNNIQSQKANLQAQIAGYQKKIEFDTGAFTKIAQEWSEYSDYLVWNEDGTPDVDWLKVEQLSRDKKNEKDVKAIESMNSAIQSAKKDLDDSNKQVRDLENQLEELNNTLKEQYIEFENKIVEALQKSVQDQIDALSDVNDSINDTNSKLIDSINKSLEKERQARDNQKTEKDLADKERRLAYLRQDSSNANALEIAQLEKELKEGQEDYTDTLIDQKVTELQQQNDEAAEQRERQIELMNASLQWQKDNGELWSQVNEMMSQSFSEEGVLIDGSALMVLLKNNEQFKSMSEIGKQKWSQEMSAMAAQAQAYIMEQMGGNKVSLKNGDKVKDKNGTEWEVIGTENGVAYVKDGNGNIRSLSDTYAIKNGNGDLTSYEDFNEVDTQQHIKDGWYTSYMEAAEKKKAEEEAKKKQQQGDSGEKIEKWGYVVTWTGDDGSKKTYTQRGFKNSTLASNKGQNYAASVGGFCKVFKHYATGGLADFTGPAWLDGTSSRPELVLNAQDTQNFIQLKNVLSSLASGDSSSTGMGGDNYFDINIQVDQLANDYDVDQLTAKIKREIYSDASYRNVKAVRNLR